MSREGLRVASVCAVLSAVTTFLLWLLPRFYDAPATFDERVALYRNPYVAARLWVNFVHIFLALAAYGAAAVRLSGRAPALAGAGFLWFVLWGFTELLGVTVNIFAVNRTWRAQYGGASAEQRTQLRTNLAGFDAVWDAMFFLLLVAFLLGSLCYGLAFLREHGAGRWVGWLFLLAVPLTAAIMLGGYAGVTVFDGAVSAIYPVLQPVSRALLGWWLWPRPIRP
jgi:hypothetical protein